MKQLKKIIENCSDNRDKLIIVLALGGLRIPSELVNIRFGDICDDVIKIHEDTKTRSREVSLFREVWEVFEQLSGDPNELSFPCRFSKGGMLGQCFQNL